jgi:carboxyl-terminal processing protease
MTLYGNSVVFLLLVLTAAAGPAAGQNAPQKLDSIGMDRAHQILYDAYDNVKKHYYDPKFHGLDWDARFKEYDGKMAGANSMSQAFSIVAAFLDALNDSHTFFRPPSRAFRLDYGYRIQMFGNKALVTRVRPGTDAESKVHPGDQMVVCNRFTVKRDSFWKMNYFFNSLWPQTNMELVLLDPAGQQRKVVVDAKIQELKKVMDLTGRDAGFDMYQIIRDQENSDHLVRQRYVEMGDVMIWKMPLFDMTDDETDHMFGIARKHKILILDLRGNPGGAVFNLERMVGNVFDHEVKISDRIGRKELKPQVAKTRGDKAFSGKIIVLVDSGSASAAELFARVMQLEKRGTVIGDQTSGSVMEARGYSNSQGVETKIFYSFSVTDADLIMADGKSLERGGVVPDEVVLPTAKDLADGKDPALARAAALAGANMEPAAVGKMFPFEWVPF